MADVDMDNTRQITRSYNELFRKAIGRVASERWLRASFHKLGRLSERSMDPEIDFYFLFVSVARLLRLFHRNIHFHNKCVHKFTRTDTGINTRRRVVLSLVGMEGP